MAKSISQIETEIQDAIDADSNLSGLTSTSGTAIWRLWKSITAMVHYVIYLEWDRFKTILSKTADEQIIGMAAWYEALCLNFTYSSTNPIARCSVRANRTKVIIKVASQSGSSLVHVSEAALASLRSYITDRMVVGTDLSILTSTADLISLQLGLRYTGNPVTVKAAVKQAVKDYLSDLPFDSDLSKSLLIDHLLGVSGVVDVSVDLLQVNIGLGYNEVTGNSVRAVAGYFELGVESGNDLITINAYV